MATHRCLTEVNALNIINKPCYCATLCTKGQKALGAGHLADETGCYLEQALIRQNAKG